jgi:hypothetical protein
MASANKNVVPVTRTSRELPPSETQDAQNWKALINMANASRAESPETPPGPPPSPSYQPEESNSSVGGARPDISRYLSDWKFRVSNLWTTGPEGSGVYGAGLMFSIGGVSFGLDLPCRQIQEAAFVLLQPPSAHEHGRNGTRNSMTKNMVQ